MMQQRAQDEAGNIWELDHAGNPVRLVQPAQAAGGRVFTLPQSPKDQRQESRQAAADAREAERLRLAEEAHAHQSAEWTASHNPDGTPKAALPAPVGDPSKHGPEFLATLPPNLRNRVEQVLDGRSMLTSREKGAPLGQQIMDAANQADPTFDESVSQARFLERKQYTGQGKGAQIVQAGERLAQHMMDAYAASKDLGGPDLGWTPASKLANIITNSTRQRQVTAYNATLPFIAGELQKLTKNGTATVQETQEIMNNLASDKPEDVRLAAFQQLGRLAQGQFGPLRESWASAWQGGNAPPMPMDFSPDTQRLFDTIAQGGDPVKMDHNGHIIGANAASAAGGVGGAGGSPPPAGGSAPPAPGGAPPGLYTLPTDGTHKVPDKRTNAAVNTFVTLGKFGMANAALQRAGFPPITPAEQVAIQKWQKANPHLRYNGADVSNLDGLSDWQKVLANKYVAPVAAGAANYFNTAAGGLPALAAGEEARGNLDVATAMNPGSSLAGQVGGFVTGSYGLGKVGKAVGLLKNAARAAPAAVDGIAPLPGWIARMAGGARAASPDLIMGVSNGAAADPNHPFIGAAEGAAGVGAGSLIGHTLLAPALRWAAETAPGQALLNVVSRIGSGSAAAEAGAADAAAAPGGAVVPPPRLDPGQLALTRSGALAPDSLPNIRGQLQDAARLKMPMALADTDPRLRMTAGSAARLSPDVRAMAEDVLGTRAAGRTGRAVRLVNENLAPTGNMADIQAANKKAAQEQSRALYEAAMGHPPVEDPALTELLNTPGGASAARHGYDYALNKGTSPGELNMSIDPATGQPRYDAALNWPTLQNIKIGMDANLEPFRSPITGRLDIPHGSPAESLQNLRARYNQHLGTLNPDYAAGNEAYAGVRARGNAAQQGFDLAGRMGPMNPEEVANIAAAVKPEHLPDFQQGVASNLADRITNTERDPYALLYGPEGAQQKLHAIFPEGAPNIGLANRMEDQFGLTRTELTGGSPTQPRRAADRLFKAGIGLGGLADAVSMYHGLPPVMTLAMTGSGALARRAAAHVDTRMSMNLADAVGPQLLNTDPTANLSALDLLLERYAARQAYERQFNRAGAGAGAVLGGAVAAGAAPR